jgi:hypothetical protein
VALERAEAGIVANPSRDAWTLTIVPVARGRTRRLRSICREPGGLEPEQLLDDLDARASIPAATARRRQIADRCSEPTSPIR